MPTRHAVILVSSALQRDIVISTHGRQGDEQQALGIGVMNSRWLSRVSPLPRKTDFHSARNDGHIDAVILFHALW